MNIRLEIVGLMICIVFGCGQNQKQEETAHESKILLGEKIDTLNLKSKIQGLWEERPTGVPYFFIQGDSIFYPHRDYEPNSYVLAVDTLMERERNTGSTNRYVITKVNGDSLYLYNLNKNQQLKLHRREIDDI